MEVDDYEKSEKFVKKIVEALKNNNCFESCSLYYDNKVIKVGESEIDWNATAKAEEETGDNTIFIYKDKKVNIEKIYNMPLETGDIQLIYDGGYLWSVMNCEFGTEINDSLMEEFEKICDEFKYTFENYSSWAMVFYEN